MQEQFHFGGMQCEGVTNRLGITLASILMGDLVH